MAEPGALPLQFVDADQVEQKCNEAVAVAVVACADDTEGQTCYICLEGGSEEGLVRMCACRGGEGFAHVSCLARGAQVAVEHDATTGWARWYSCRQCQREYHGVVRCALGWACWKTYVGRPEANLTRRDAMNQLGNGLHAANHHEDALTVRKAELVTLWRLDTPEDTILTVKGNLANSYQRLGRNEQTLRLRRAVYNGRLELMGEEHPKTLRAAYNYASSLGWWDESSPRDQQRFEEAKSLLRRTMPVAQRVLGENHDITHMMRLNYAETLYEDDRATLDDLREAVDTLVETAPTVRRVFGNSHPLREHIEIGLQRARDALSEAQAMRIRELFEAELELGSEETQPSGDA